MSESTLIRPPKPLYTPPDDLMKLVAQLAKGVAEGTITSLMCVTVSPAGQMQWPGYGMQMAELLLGAELAREDIKKAIRGQTGKILRVS